MLTLAIPVGIFLFLKIFGNNEYDVPYLFETGIPGCNETEKTHQVPDITLKNADGDTSALYDLNGYLVFGYMDMSDRISTEKKMVELVRIQDAFFETNPPKFVLLTDSTSQLPLQTLASTMGMAKGNCMVARLNGVRADDFLTCGIALTSPQDHQPHNLVLVDPAHHIMGIYNALEVEKTDLLILELKILLSKK